MSNFSPGRPIGTRAVARAVAGWDALELEEAIIAAKGAGGMVRSRAEWADHKQGKAGVNVDTRVCNLLQHFRWKPQYSGQLAPLWSAS